MRNRISLGLGLPLQLAVAAIAIGAASAVDTIGERSVPRDQRVAPAPVPVLDAGIPWSPDVDNGNIVRAKATSELMSLLSLSAWAVVTIAGFSIVLVSASQASTRRVEMQVRRAVGASRRSLFYRLVAEGGAGALLAGAVGSGLGAFAAARAAHAWAGVPATWHWPSIAVVAIVAVVLGLGGLFPLGYAWPRRVGQAPPAPPSLGLAAFQIGVGLTVLVASQLVRDRAAAVARPDGTVLHAGTGLVYQVPGDSSLRERSHRFAELLDRLQADSGVALASLASPGALAGIGTVDLVETDCGNCYVGGIVLRMRLLRATYQSASADTFSARGIVVAEGRNFTAADSVGAKPVVIVNRYLAARYFENGRALGRALWLGGRIDGKGYEVVGVVDDGGPAGFGAGIAPREALYLSTFQHPPRLAELVVRPRGSPGAAPPGRAALARSLGTVPPAVEEAELQRRDRAPIGWFAERFQFEGLMLALLATAGVFGLMLLWVGALRPELAIRRSVGASKRRIALYVLGHAAWTALKGIAIGLVFFAPFLWGEIDRIAPGLSSIPWDPILRYGALLVVLTLLGALAPAAIAATRPPAADL